MEAAPAPVVASEAASPSGQYGSAAEDLDLEPVPVELTALGQHLSRLPMDVRIGKMLIYGSLLLCAEEVLTIAAMLNVRNPFISPADKRDEANEAKRLLLGEGVEVTQSDHLCLLYAFERWNACPSDRERRALADRYFLSHQSLCEARDLRRDLRRTLAGIGFDATSTAASPPSSSHSSSFSAPASGPRKGAALLSRESVTLVKAALCAGLYPNVINVKKPLQKFAETVGGNVAKAPQAQQLRMLVRKPELVAGEAPPELSEYEQAMAAKQGGPRHQFDDVRVFIHPASVNFKQREYRCPWMVFREKVKTSKVFIRDCTVVSPYSMLLFGGKVEVQHEKGTVTVDGWITFRAQARIGVLVRELRRVLELLLVEKIQNPSIDIAATDVMLAIKNLIIGGGFNV